jgi:hypothetical protein
MRISPRRAHRLGFETGNTSRQQLTVGQGQARTSNAAHLAGSVSAPM